MQKKYLFYQNVRKPSKTSKSLEVTIPRAVVEMLELKEGDYVKIEISKAD